MIPDPIYQFVVESDYTDESIAEWSQAFPQHAKAFHRMAMEARLDRIKEEAGEAFDAYLPPEPEDETVCW